MSEDKCFVSSKRRGKAAERGKTRHHMAKAMERKSLDNSILTRYQYCKVSAINRGIFAVWMDRKGCVFLKGKTRRVGVVVLNKI